MYVLPCSSHKIFKHISCPSLNDLCIPTISQNVSQGCLVTDPGQWDAPPPRYRSRLIWRMIAVHPFLRWHHAF